VHAQGVPPFNNTATVIVSEIMINPKGVSRSNGTWFELYNQGDQPSNLSNCVFLLLLSGGKQAISWIPAGTVIPPNGYFVVGGDNNTATNGNVTVDLKLDVPNLSFNETAGFIQLVYPPSDLKFLLIWGAKLDQVLSTGNAGILVTGANLTTDPPFEAGASLSFKNVSKKVLAGSAITVAEWCVTEGTPKAGNGKCLPTPTKAPITPTKAPTQAPLIAPVSPSAKAPSKVPTKVPTKAPVSPSAKTPTQAPLVSPVSPLPKPPSKVPTKVPTKAPLKGPTKSPTKIPTKAPTKIPTKALTIKKCGLLGLRIFCPRTFCGVGGRFLGWCKN
jgi:hypothetical protein